MNAEVKQLLRDLNAAVIITSSDAVNLALDGLLQLPGVLSNDRMDSSFLTQVILPVGKTLSALSPTQIRPLLTHELAAGRAVGTAAIAYRFMKNKDADDADMDLPANDRRLEIRTVLGNTLNQLISESPDRAFKLGKRWIQKPSPRFRSTALSIYPKLFLFFDDNILNLLLPMNKEEDRDVRWALASSLSEIARSGSQAPMLNLLSIWSKEADPNIWVICRVLSGSWAVNYSTEVESILLEIKTKTRETNLINSTKKALKRHGLEINLG